MFIYKRMIINIQKIKSSYSLKGTGLFGAVISSPPPVSLRAISTSDYLFGAGATRFSIKFSSFFIYIYIYIYNIVVLFKKSF